jgi:hypothetical protein
VRDQFKTFILEDGIGTFDVDFCVLIGWVYIVDHIINGSVDHKLISQPGVKLRDQLVDSCEFGDFPDNLGLE